MLVQLQLVYLIIDIVSHLFVLSHTLGVYGKYLHATLLVGESDLHLHFESTWPHQRLVYHVATIRHSDN